VISFLRRTRQLKPGAFPSLRVSLFAGEALATTAFEAWASAAPNSVVDNHYGPTETTVACTAERGGATPRATPERDIVAIGRPYPGTLAAIVAPAGSSYAFLPRGEMGSWPSRGRRSWPATSAIPS